MAGKNAVSRVGQIGAFAQAQNHVVASGFPNYPVYQDVTASPVKSPVTLAAATPQLINIPAAAVSISILSAVAVNVSDTSGSTNGSYGIPANVEVTIPLVTPSNDPQDATGQLWLTSAPGGVCSFRFSCV